MIWLQSIVILFVVQLATAKIEYPDVRRDETVVDTFYGSQVKDPYRWLEDPTSEEVKQFISGQNDVTKEYVDQPIRSEIHASLLKAYDYPRQGVVRRYGSRYFFFKNTGTQNQDVWYVQDSLEAEPKIFLDPNLLSEDGMVSINHYTFTEDGELVTYMLNEKGSDWIQIRIRNVSSGVDYPEVLRFVKFSTAEWTHDNRGFFYARYPIGSKKSSADGTETERVANQRIYYHKLGTSQDEDVLVVEFPEEPDWLLGDFEVSREGNYLFVFPSKGASGEAMVYYANLVEPLKKGIKSKLDLLPVVPRFGAKFEYVTNDDSIVYFFTNQRAPNYRIVGIDLNQPGEEYWSTVVPEDPKRVLQWAFTVNEDKLVLGYLEDVKSTLELRFLGNGSFIQNFPLEIGTVSHYSGRRSHDEFFFNFVSFFTPGKIFRVDLSSKPYQTKIIKEVVAPGIDASKFVVHQVFYPSKDGTKVPMFVFHKKDYVPQRNSPTFLYGYGGFNVNLLPAFKPERVVFVKNFDGVYAIPNIRGGGEYGRDWHHGGRLLNKQNSFDDFQAAAEYLIAQNYTVPSKIVINGGSNGGFLIGACVNQRPELYGAGIAQVGVLDLLRFQKFTIGYAWCTEYGCSDDGDQTHFENLYKLSPLHNVRVPKNESVQYPSILLMTGDHDDRVVPLHSYKHIAELQHSVGRSSRQTNPLLLRVTFNVGHGAGKPTSVKISEFADIYSYLVKAVGFKFVA